MDTGETIASEHFIAEIHYDTYCGNPFDEWDQIGILAANPRSREGHGQKDGDWEDAIQAYYRVGVRIADYGSSGWGITWENIPPGFRPEHELEEYDAICYTTRQRAEFAISGPQTTPAQIWDALTSDLQVWKQWMNGDVYGVIVTDHDGNDVESCWGFLGYDDYTEPARDMLDQAEATYAHEQNLLATTGGWVTI